MEIPYEEIHQSDWTDRADIASRLLANREQRQYRSRWRVPGPQFFTESILATARHDLQQGLWGWLRRLHLHGAPPGTAEPYLQLHHGIYRFRSYDPLSAES